MAIETALCAEIRFNDIGSKKEKEEILKELSLALECEPEFYESLDMFCFTDLNFMSHVDSNEVYQIIERYRKFVDYFTYSLWYIEEPHDKLYFQNNEWTRKEILV